MGLFDKMKNFVTGGHAKLTLDKPALAFPGQPFGIKISVVAAADFESAGVYIDVSATESAEIKVEGQQQPITKSHPSFSQAFLISGPFALKQGETKEFAGTVTLPRELQPSFKGRLAKHEYHIRGRIDTKGNDPDSGYVELRVGDMT